MSKYDAFADDETPYRDRETMETLYVEKRMSMSEIADELGCGVATISRWIDKLDIGARSVSEGNRQTARSKPAHFTTNNRGREVWIDNAGGETDTVLVHRLLAVAEYGFDAVVGNHVHHRKNIPWLNTPKNIIPMDPTEHLQHHKKGNTIGEKIGVNECLDIRTWRSDGVSKTELADKYAVSERTIRRHAQADCHHS